VPAYRITVDALDDALDVDALDPVTGGEGFQSLSFFASTENEIFAEASQLRHHLGCSALHATKLALCFELIGGGSPMQTAPRLVIATRSGAQT
jgi:hypothetical protein